MAGAYLYLSPNLPSVESLRHTELQMPLHVYSKDNQLIEEFGEMRRTPISFDQIPKDFINALLSAEDDNFIKHHGVDPGSLLRAAAQIRQKWPHSNRRQYNHHAGGKKLLFNAVSAVFHAKPMKSC